MRESQILGERKGGKILGLKNLFRGTKFLFRGYLFPGHGVQSIQKYRFTISTPGGQISHFDHGGRTLQFAKAIKRFVNMYKAP